MPTIAAVAAQFSTDAPLALWPAAWPLWAQLVIAVLIYDFVDYWKHRAYHEWAWAWPIHALHHNATKMHVFKAGRLHFLEAAIRAGVTSAPLGSLVKLTVTAGASAPEDLVEALIAAISARFAADVQEVVVTRENVTFKLPRVLVT